MSTTNIHFVFVAVSLTHIAFLYGSVVFLLSVHVLVASVLSQQLHCLQVPYLSPAW